MSKTARLWTFAAVCAVAALGIGLSLSKAILRTESRARPTRAVQLLPAPPPKPFLMFISLIADDTWGRVGLAPLDSPNGARYVTSLACDRVYYAGRRGLCLATETRLVPTFVAYVFDESFNRLQRIPLTGPPSRARVSPDGRLGAVTVFEAGHSYADAGFSTRTTLIDMLGGSVIADLEAFAVSDDGGPVRSPNFNFWGVTFARDSNKFFATLDWGTGRALIEGNVRARTARILVPDVECPSLSPDNTRVVFKKRMAATGPQPWRGWQLWGLDLPTGSQRALSGKTASVDDQVDWLDDGRVLFFSSSEAGNNITVLGVDTTEPARVLVSDASSPAVVR